MSKVKIQGNASGTGVLTVTAPNTSTDRTITLPDSTGTLATTADVPAGISSSADATAITIGSDESVGINNSTGFGTYSGTGVKYSKGDGTFFVGRDGGQPLWLNRETSQGDLIGLAAAGSTHARIGTTSNALVLKTGTGGNTERMRIDSDGHITMPNQPAFSAQTSGGFSLSSTNSLITIPYNTERFDQNADFNTSTYTFTAPVTGKYQFNIITRLDDVDSAATYYHVYFVTSNRNYFDIFDPRGFDQDLGYLGLTVPCLADMDANDTAIVKIYQAGGSVQTTMAGTTDSHFSGYLVC